MTGENHTFGQVVLYTPNLKSLLANAFIEAGSVWHSGPLLVSLKQQIVGNLPAADWLFQLIQVVVTEKRGCSTLCQHLKGLPPLLVSKTSHETS